LLQYHAVRNEIRKADSGGRDDGKQEYKEGNFKAGEMIHGMVVFVGTNVGILAGKSVMEVRVLGVSC